MTAPAATIDVATVADLIRLRAREHPDAPFLRYEHDTITYGEMLTRALRVATMLRARLPQDAPHVGVLMENRPEYVDVILGAALAGAVVVGVNATRRGAELERDIAHTDCALLIVDREGRRLLSGLRTPPVLEISAGYEEALGETRDDAWPVDADDLFLLVFTSGTAGAPKAVRCSHRRMLGTGGFIAQTVGLTSDDVAYVAMPLFHSNPQQCGLMPVLLRGASVALARRFSVRAFLSDVRLHGATYFPYSGKPLSFLLTAPERPNDADNPLRVCFGNEGSWRVIERFERRFGCRVIDGFGPSEGGMGFARAPEDPPGSVGRPPEHIKVLRDDGAPCPPARFDANGRLLNPEECVGEIVNTAGLGRFEGYYANPEADARRARDGMYWSGDLGYMDERGYLYFAGRTEDWIRVDGENFPPRPIEELVERHPDVFACAAYGVPDAEAGDRVMIAVQPAPGRTLRPDALFRFLAGQPDLSPKWLPTYVLVADELPRGATGKVLVRELRREKFLLGRARGPVWWRERGDATFKPFEPDDERRLRAAFHAAGREHLLTL